MTKLTKTTMLILLISIVLSGCAVFMDSGAKALQGTSWKLVSYGPHLPLPGSVMSIEFSTKDIRGSASCNQYFGAYRIIGDQISINDLGWTEMACLDPEGIMEQEQTLMGLLAKAAEYKVEGNTLQITTNSGEVLVFERLAQEE